MTSEHFNTTKSLQSLTKGSFDSLILRIKQKQINELKSLEISKPIHKQIEISTNTLEILKNKLQNNEQIPMKIKSNKPTHIEQLSQKYNLLNTNNKYDNDYKNPKQSLLYYQLQLQTSIEQMKTFEFQSNLLLPSNAHTFRKTTLIERLLTNLYIERQKYNKQLYEQKLKYHEPYNCLNLQSEITSTLNQMREYENNRYRKLQQQHWNDVYNDDIENTSNIIHVG
jgi:hypothetical protein